jgi:hypothetical protein
MVFKQTIKLSDMQKFTAGCFDNPKEAEKAANVVKGILDSQSPRISNISHAMRGNPQANYKAIQRFLDSSNTQEALNRLYYEEAPFILADPTDIERRQAKKTEYVGRLKDGKTLGFQVLPLAFPYRGRAIPFHFITYSSKTISHDSTSRNLEHRRAIGKLKDLFGDKPLVMDREFSYEEFFQSLVVEGMKFVIRLNVSGGATVVDDEGQRVMLSIRPGEKVLHKGVFYKGKVKVNLAGEWQRGFREPLWVISNLEPEAALDIYKTRMKIEQAFRDLKSLLRLDKIMNKSQRNMERMTALVLIAYGIALLIGEAFREQIYRGKKSKLYSGLFILLRHNMRLANEVVSEIVTRVHSLFNDIIFGNVRTNV